MPSRLEQLQTRLRRNLEQCVRIDTRFAEHICRTWPEEHGDDLTHVNRYVVSEDVTRDTIDDPADREKRVAPFYRHGCGDNEPKVIDRPYS